MPASACRGASTRPSTATGSIPASGRWASTPCGRAWCSHGARPTSPNRRRAGASRRAEADAANFGARRPRGGREAPKFGSAEGGAGAVEVVGGDHELDAAEGRVGELDVDVGLTQ